MLFREFLRFYSATAYTILYILFHNERVKADQWQQVCSFNLILCVYPISQTLSVLMSHESNAFIICTPFVIKRGRTKTRLHVNTEKQCYF